MSTKDQTLRVLAELRPEIERRYHVKEIGLFGSAVRGEDNSASDIDVLVQFSRPVGFFKFIELQEFLESKLNRKVDLVSQKALKPLIGKAILSEVVML